MARVLRCPPVAERLNSSSPGCPLEQNKKNLNQNYYRSGITSWAVLSLAPVIMRTKQLPAAL